VTPLEQLRLAVALGHGTPGAELRLHAAGGETVIVSSHPAADLDHCALRRVVLDGARPDQPDQPDHSDRIAAVEFGGALDDLGGGVFRVARDGLEQRRIASLLCPDRVAGIIETIAIDDRCERSMHACLKPDTDLAVTLVVITTDDPGFVTELDEVASRISAAIFVEELWCTAMQLTPEPQYRRKDAS
jgi:hypothetical protein